MSTATTSTRADTATGTPSGVVGPHAPASHPKGSTMTTPTTTSARRRPGADSPPPRRAATAARIGSLARAEILLLVRNRTTLFNALALAPATVGFLAWIGAGSFPGATGGGQATARFLLTTLTAIALIFVVYYNLTTTLVARREELVLKRLLTGEVSRVEVVVACAVPAVTIVLAQLVLGAIAVGVWFAVPAVANPLWIVLAIVGGTVVFVLLAVISSGVTRTVESAQLTTLPVIMVAMALSGFTVPMDLLPDVVQTIASWTPMYPVVALLDAGLGGRPSGDLSLSGLGQPLLCLVLWTVNGAWAARRWMRWEPRR
jgi:ABC-2 type transport system permease protein